MEDWSHLPLVERLGGIVSFLPALQQGKNMTALDDFVQAAYRYGWVRSMDWPKWAQSSEAAALRDDPAVLAQATEHQLACLLTTCIRQERFCEGVLQAHYQSGLLANIVERAAAMLRSLEAAEASGDEDLLKTTMGE